MGARFIPIHVFLGLFIMYAYFFSSDKKAYGAIFAKIHALNGIRICQFKDRAMF